MDRIPSTARPLGKLHTIAETAEILQTSERTIQRLIASKKLRAHNIGRLVRIADADIAALLDSTRSD
jgi:excisionase family DNA binding protein